MGMGITDFSTASGVRAHTLRRLHADGRFVPAGVSSGGHRRYESWQIEYAAEFVKKMKLLPNGKNVVVDVPSLGSFFPYLLGIVMADGTRLQSGQVQLEMKDRQILDDLSEIMGCEVHPHAGREMFRITVPSKYAHQLGEYGVCPNKGKKGFDTPNMCEADFCHFLRGLFDGDGSRSKDDSVIRFHGHPKSMSHIQATLLEEFGLYLPWVEDKRCNSGMLESGRKAVVKGVNCLMYREDVISLKRKHSQKT